MFEVSENARAPKSEYLAVGLALLSFALLFAGIFLYTDKSETTGSMLILASGFAVGLSIPRPASRPGGPVLTGVLLFMLVLCACGAYVLSSGGGNLFALIVFVLVAFSTGQLAAMRGVFTGAFENKAESLLKK